MEEKPGRKQALSDKQAAFVREYVQCWNATEAARRAGYKGEGGALGAIGYENLRKPYIDAAIKEAVQGAIMTQEEAMSRMSEIARGEYARYIRNASEVVSDDGKAITINLVQVDIEAMTRDGKAHLIKSITPTRYGNRIEFYDMQSALETILKATGAFKEQLDLNVNAGEIIVVAGVDLGDV